MASLDAMAKHLQAAARGAEPSAALRAETALEELLTNSVMHGGASEVPQAAVWLSVEAHGQDLALCYEDNCPAFDPMAKIDEALRRTANPMEQRPPGGLGLLMVFRLADGFRYRHENGRNRIDLSFKGRRA